eukprot:5891350-Pyramimonas_sp.AAC.1
MQSLQYKLVTDHTYGAANTMEDATGAASSAAHTGPGGAMDTDPAAREATDTAGDQSIASRPVAVL